MTAPLDAAAERADGPPQALAPRRAAERAPAGLSWLSIIRLGLVQTALGAVVVLCTATINRVMIVELSLLAIVPAALVGFYHAFQLLRPGWGHGADQGRARTPWVIGGMAALALGAVGAALATAWMETSLAAGLALAAPSFALLGLGLGAAATNLLAMLAAHVAPERKAAAGSLVWILMIAGLAISGVTIGQVLDPYSGERLVMVSLAVAAIALSVCVLALWGVERRAAASPLASRRRERSRSMTMASFRAAAREVWRDEAARGFTLFVFVSMLAYNTQDLILEPFGGHVFGMTPGQSTALGGALHAGALIGMVIVFVAGLLRAADGRFAALTPSTRAFVVGGCLGSGAMLAALGVGGVVGSSWPLHANVIALGFCNGVFAVAAIGAMMGLASGRADDGAEESGAETAPQRGKEGVRMGVFGAAQSIGFALGAGFGAAALDVLRALTGALAESYATVFAFEGGLFLLSALLAARILRESPVATPTRAPTKILLPQGDA